MKVAKTAFGFNFEQDQIEFIDKKFSRIDYAADLIENVSLRVKFDKKKYILDIDAHFRHGIQIHVSNEDFTFEAGLNLLMDVLDQKVQKEKSKLQDKH